MAQKVRFYQRADVGAPTGLAYNSTAGVYFNALKACLVDGYSIGTVSSIERTLDTVTVTMAAAPGIYNYGSWITISGCDQPEYNGEFLVEMINSTQFTYKISGTPVSPATGTPTAFKASAGWTLPFTGITGVNAFKQPAGNGFYCYVDDNQTYNTWYVGFEEMTAYGTGTQRFPTSGQAGMYKGYSGTNSWWCVLATDTWFYFFVRPNDNNAYIQSVFFGDIETNLLQDAFHTALIGGTNTTASSSTSYLREGVAMVESSEAGWMARSHTQVGGSVGIHRFSTGTRTVVNNTIGAAGLTFPDPITNNFFTCPIYCHVSGAFRGKLPRILGPYHARPHGSHTYVDIEGVPHLALYHYNSGQIYLELDSYANVS